MRDVDDTQASPSTSVDGVDGGASAAAAAGESTPAAASSSSASSKKKTPAKSKLKKDLEPVEVDPNYPGQRFKIGELIYANYAEGKQWFEAKVLKVEKRADLIYYYLHYQGWGDKVRERETTTHTRKQTSSFSTPLQRTRARSMAAHSFFCFHCHVLLTHPFTLPSILLSLPFSSSMIGVPTTRTLSSLSTMRRVGRCMRRLS